MSEISKKMEGNRKLRGFPQGRPLDRVVLVGGATRMPCVQVRFHARRHTSELHSYPYRTPHRAYDAHLERIAGLLSVECVGTRSMYSVRIEKCQGLIGWKGLAVRTSGSCSDGHLFCCKSSAK